MARATAAWTDTDDNDWEPGDLIRVTNFKEQVLQNVEHIAQTHNHDGTDDMGGNLKATDGMYQMYYIGG